MWPWGHLAVGYLLYSALGHFHAGRSPSGAAALFVAFGTQFPDVVDKPLAWGLGVLPHGRVGAHSLPIVAVVLALAYAYARYRGRSDLAVAFGVGYLTHPFADAFLALSQSRTEYVTYLLWPLTDLVPYDTDGTVLTSLGGFELTVYGVAQLGLVLIAYGVWAADGRPGRETFRRVLGLTGNDREATFDQ